jgi:Ala-tRNA(Pro) deacylase
MMESPVLNFHPLDNTQTTAIAPDGLLEFLAATGHPPQILDFSA